MKKNDVTKTDINEIGRSSARAPSEGILFDQYLSKKIEDRILQPFVIQSLKDFIPSPLVSYENEYARKIEGAWKNLQEYVKKIEGGLKALQSAGIRIEFKERHRSCERPDDLKIHQEMIQKRKRPQEIFNISSEIMKSSYEEASKQYQNKDYAKAGNILEVLLYLNPTFNLYWQLLGMVEHELGHLESAAEALRIGLQKGSSALVPYVHFINCLVDLKRLDEADEVIHKALSIEHPTDSNALVIQQALGNLRQALAKRSKTV